MTTAINITQSAVFTSLGNFIITAIPETIEVIQAQGNRVPEPEGQDFVVMTSILKERLEWNNTTFSDGYPNNPQTRTDLAPTKITIQLDFHGPNAAENVQAFSTLFFSSYGFDTFAAYTNGDIKPLYCSNVRESPFINGEQQYETMWSVDAMLQANITTTVTQDFAAAVVVDVISVEATYAK